MKINPGLLSPDEIEAVLARAVHSPKFNAETYASDVLQLGHHISALSRQPAPVVTAMLEKARKMRNQNAAIYEDALCDDKQMLEHSCGRRCAANEILAELESIASALPTSNVEGDTNDATSD